MRDCPDFDLAGASEGDEVVFGGWKLALLGRAGRRKKEIAEGSDPIGLHARAQCEQNLETEWVEHQHVRVTTGANETGRRRDGSSGSSTRKN